MTDRLDRILLALLFFWVPLAHFNRAADGFTLTKEVIGLMVVAYFVLLALMQDHGIFKQRLVQAVLLFALWMVVDAYTVSVAPGEVLTASFHLYLIAGTVIAVVYACSRGLAYERFLHWALLAGVFMSLYGMAQVAGLDRTDWSAHFEARAFATLGNPDYLGGHLIGLLPVAFVMTLRTYGQLPLSTKGAPLVTTRQKSWFWLRMMTLIVFVGLLLARVKGSFIALVGVAVFLAVVFLLPVGRELFQRNKRYVLVCLGVLVVGGAAYLVRHGGFEAFGFKQVTVQQRIENYQVAWEMLKDHFGLGVGLGQVGVQYAVYQSKPYPASEYPQHPVIQSTHIHNDFLQYAVEGGVVGLALFLLVLGTFAWSVFRSFKSPESGKEEKELLVGVLAGMVGLLVQSLSNFPLRVAPTSILFGSLLAAPLALRARSARIEAPAAPGRNFWVSLVLFIVLVLGVRWMAASVALRNTLGETGLRNGQLALHYGERLMGLSAGDWKAWEARAASLQLVGQLDPAFDAYQRSLGLNPYSMEALSSMATIRLSQGRPAEGLELTEKSLALTPNYTGTLWTRAICLFQLKRFEESAKQFEVLTSYMPNDPQTYLNLGVCYMNLGRKADAIMVWKRSLQLDPNNEQTKAYLKSVGVKAP